tara:strand:+ start:12 stop:776 length:765 start_codon:yes stop_codon:yes gene_type:complete
MIRVFFSIFLCSVTICYGQSTIPHKLQDIGVQEQLGRTVSANYQFIDSVTGEFVGFNNFFRQDKPVLLSFVYYSCPMLCHFITGGLVQTIDQLSQSTLDDLVIVSISINPDDTIEQARAFQQRYVSQLKKVKPNWRFLLDYQGNVKRLADQVGFKYRLADSGEYSHSAMLLFLSPKQIVSRYLYGINYSSLDFKLAVIDAKSDQHVSTVERLLLFCYNYDPQSKKYSLYALRLMKLGAVLTIVVLVGMIWRFRR